MPRRGQETTERQQAEQLLEPLLTKEMQAFILFFFCVFYCKERAHRQLHMHFFQPFHLKFAINS